MALFQVDGARARHDAPRTLWCLSCHVLPERPGRPGRRVGQHQLDASAGSKRHRLEEVRADVALHLERDQHRPENDEVSDRVAPVRIHRPGKNILLLLVLK